MFDFKKDNLLKKDADWKKLFPGVMNILLSLQTYYPKNKRRNKEQRKKEKEKEIS